MDISPVGIIVGFFPFPFSPLLLLIFFGPLAKKPRARREPSQTGIVGRRRRRRGIRGQGMPHPSHYQTISGGRGRGGEGPRSLSVPSVSVRKRKEERKWRETFPHIKMGRKGFCFLLLRSLLSLLSSDRRSSSSSSYFPPYFRLLFLLLL